MQTQINRKTENLSCEIFPYPYSHSPVMVNHVQLKKSKTCLRRGAAMNKIHAKKKVNVSSHHTGEVK